MHLGYGPCALCTIKMIAFIHCNDLITKCKRIVCLVKDEIPILYFSSFSLESTKAMNEMERELNHQNEILFFAL